MFFSFLLLQFCLFLISSFLYSSVYFYNIKDLREIRIFFAFIYMWGYRKVSIIGEFLYSIHTTIFRKYI